MSATILLIELNEKTTAEAIEKYREEIARHRLVITFDPETGDAGVVKNNLTPPTGVEWVIA